MMNNELVVATNAGLVDIQIEYRSLADLLLDKRNPRQHPQRQIDQLAESKRVKVTICLLCIRPRSLSNW